MDCNVILGHPGQTHLLPSAPSLGAALLASAIGEGVAHSLRRDGHEVRTISDDHVGIARQTFMHLVNQAGGTNGLALIATLDRRRRVCG